MASPTMTYLLLVKKFTRVGTTTHTLKGKSLSIGSTDSSVMRRVHVPNVGEVSFRDVEAMI
jgi:hypothetical protein